jgi:hypothetical protein
MSLRSLPAIVFGAALVCAAAAAEPLEALIVDGQNNHGNWPQTTKMMKRRSAHRFCPSSFRAANRPFRPRARQS